MSYEKFKLEIGGKELKVEARNLAEQSSGNVLVQYGGTMVLATAVMANYEREGVSFFPLSGFPMLNISMVREEKE